MDTKIPLGGFFTFGGHTRRHDLPVTGVVMHASAGASLAGDLATLRERHLTYHYLIDKDGTTYKLLAGAWVAYHAGNSYGPNEEAIGVGRQQDSQSRFIAGCSVNDYTIGISFVNLNDGHEEITPEQYRAAVELVQELPTQFPTLAWVSTHAVVSPHRKTDPILLDLDAFAGDCGLKAWRYSG